MKPQLHEFPEMVEELVQGGFSEPQSTSLVKFVSRVLSGHHEHLDAAQAENREQFAQVRREIDSKLDAAQTENREQFAQVRGEIDSKLDAAQAENREQFAQVRGEIDSKIDAAQAENREQFAQVRGEFAQVRGEFDSKLDAAQAENREQFAISRKETQAGFDQLKGWMIAMLSALLVAFIGAATAFMMQQ